MSVRYSSSAEYYRTVLVPPHDAGQWKSVKLAAGLEMSNYVSFARVACNTLNVTLSGTASHESRMDGKVDGKPTKPDEVIAMPAGIQGEFAWETHGDFERSLVLQFDDEVFEQYAPEIMTGAFAEGHLRPRDYSAQPNLVWLIKLLAEELDPLRRRGALYAETLIRLLAMEIAQTSWSVPIKGERGSERSDDRVRRVVDLIETDFAEDLSLRQLAQEAGLSPGQLIEIFKLQTGKTPYSFLIDRRLRHAIELLRRTEFSIARVAVACGFADQQHLTRVCRKRLGRTPASYRKERLVPQR